MLTITLTSKAHLGREALRQLFPKVVLDVLYSYRQDCRGGLFDELESMFFGRNTYLSYAAATPHKALDRQGIEYFIRNDNARMLVRQSIQPAYLFRKIADLGSQVDLLPFTQIR